MALICYIYRIVLKRFVQIHTRSPSKGKLRPIYPRINGPMIRPSWQYGKLDLVSPPLWALERRVNRSGGTCQVYEKYRRKLRYLHDLLTWLSICHLRCGASKIMENFLRRILVSSFYGNLVKRPPDILFIQ